MAFRHNQNHGQLTITGASGTVINIMSPGWRCLNLQTLSSSPPVVGSDRLIPGRSGALPFRRRATAGTYSLELLFCGDVDQTGAARAPQFCGPWGVEANIAWVRSSLCTQPTSTAGTYSATLYFPFGGAGATTDIHVLGLTVGESVGWGKTRAVLDISVPAGSFTV